MTLFTMIFIIVYLFLETQFIFMLYYQNKSFKFTFKTWGFKCLTILGVIIVFYYFKVNFIQTKSLYKYSQQ